MNARTQAQQQKREVERNGGGGREGIPPLAPTVLKRKPVKESVLALDFLCFVFPLLRLAIALVARVWLVHSVDNLETSYT